MKKIAYFSCFACLIVWIFLLFFTNQSMADTYCVADENDLINALLDAKDNGSDDIVKIQQGTYMWGGDWQYRSYEPFGFTIEGGYNAGCTARVADPSNTVLLGDFVLGWYPDVAVNGNLVVRGINLQTGNLNADSRREGNVYLINSIISNGDFRAYSQNTITITNNIIKNGEVRAEGGGIGTPKAKTITLTNNDCRQVRIIGTETAIFSDHIIHNGSSKVSVQGDTVIFKNNIINNNTQAGPAISLNALLSLTMTNNIISNNEAEDYAGGIVIVVWDFGTISNNTISNNKVTSWGAYAGGLLLWLYYDNAVVDIYNNIIWNNFCVQPGRDIAIYNDDDNNGIPSTVNLFNNDFDQSSDGIYIQRPFPIDPSNLNNLDPLFVDPVNGDFHLRGNSPCIDTGTSVNAPDNDIDGDARPQGSGFDIGADEFTCFRALNLNIEYRYINTTETFEACGTIAVGPYVNVTSTGDVTFQAGDRVILKSGFSVEDGGRLSVVIDPSTGRLP